MCVCAAWVNFAHYIREGVGIFAKSHHAKIMYCLGSGLLQLSASVPSEWVGILECSKSLSFFFIAIVRALWTQVLY